MSSISFSVGSEYDIARKNFCRHKYYIFNRSLINLSFYICLHHSLHNELVQPCLGKKANPDQDTSATRSQLHLIPSLRLSGKYFALSNYVILKSCLACAYERNSAGKYKKTKTSNFCEKCNVYVCKSMFRAISYPQSTEKEIDYMIYL